MEFEQLIGKIELLKKATLIGLSAHTALAPSDRLAFKEYKIPENAKKAGVLLLLYPNKENKACILLTKRASYKGTHSNQISFPGGKKDLSDKNLQTTALREAFEEVGVYQKDIEAVKELTPIYIPPSNFIVNAYIGVTERKPSFTPNYEVDELIEVPLHYLLNKMDISSSKNVSTAIKNIETPYFLYKNHQIWGATAMILNEFKEVLKIL